MNAWPMRRRFSCGSVTPASAARNRSSASTTCRSVLKWSRELGDHRRLLRPSAAGRCRPGCTRAAGRSPGRAAPRRPPNRRRPTGRRSRGRSPTRWRIALDRLARRSRPASRCRGSRRRAVRKLRSICAAERRVRHLGMELHAEDRQRPVLAPRRSGRSSVLASGTKSSETLRHLVAVAHPHVAVCRARRRTGRCVRDHVQRRPAKLAGRGARRPCRPAPRRRAACRSRCRARECRARKIAGSHFGAPGS